MTDDLPVSELIEARHKAARLVAVYGDELLPLFERLDKEIAMRQGVYSAKDRALLIAKNPQFQTQSL